MITRKNLFTFILCALQLSFFNSTFATQIRDTGQQQQIQQDQQQHHDTQSNSGEDNGYLHGLITDSPSDDQTDQTEHAQDQPTANTNSDSQMNIESTTESTTKLQEDISEHTCSFIHDPCEKCECTGCHEACEYCPNTWFCSECKKKYTNNDRIQYISQLVKNRTIQLKDAIKSISKNDIKVFLVFLGTWASLSTLLLLLPNAVSTPIVYTLGAAELGILSVIVGTVAAQKWKETPIYDSKKR